MLQLAFVFLLSLAARADVTMTKPLIEGGLSGGMGYVPDYPAAAQGQFRYLAFPVFHLRGRILRSDDEDGSRARLLRNTTFAFELSASGSFPTSSDDNRARAGMDDLEWLGELGPRVFVSVHTRENISLRLSLSVRGAFSTNFTSGHYRGLTLTPSLAYDHKRLWSENLALTVRLTPQFASQELQAYFYDVPEHDQVPGRPAYGSKAGYIGTSLTPALWFERGNYGIFAGLSASFHDGAANEQSPLFKERVTYAGFTGFRWYFYKSEARGYL